MAECVIYGTLGSKGLSKFLNSYSCHGNLRFVNWIIIIYLVRIKRNTSKILIMFFLTLKDA